MGTGMQAGTGCPQHTGLGAYPWLPVPPESRAGSVLDFRVVETGLTFLRLAWQPGPEPPQGYGLSYAVQGEGTVPARGRSCLDALPLHSPLGRAGHGRGLHGRVHARRGACMEVMQGVHAESATGVCTPAFTAAAGARAQAVGPMRVRRRGGGVCVPTPGGFGAQGSKCAHGCAQQPGPPCVPLPGAESAGVCVPPRLLCVGGGQ